MKVKPEVLALALKQLPAFLGEGCEFRMYRHTFIKDPYDLLERLKLEQGNYDMGDFIWHDLDSFLEMWPYGLIAGEIIKANSKFKQGEIIKYCTIGKKWESVRVRDDFDEEDFIPGAVANDPATFDRVMKEVEEEKKRKNEQKN